MSENVRMGVVAEYGREYKKEESPTFQSGTGKILRVDELNVA